MNAPLANIVRTLRRFDTRESSDGQLLRQFADHNDEDAFALLVRRHGQLVFGVCRRILGHVHDAEDAAQATFLVLARKAGAVAWEESIAGWLHEVAVRVSLDARHALFRRRAREQQTKYLPEKKSAERESVDRTDVLDEELSRLPAKLRAPLILCYLKGCTRDEAAEQLGWTLSLVKTRLEQGRNLLRSRLSKRGLTLGAVLTAALVTRSAEAALPAAQLGKISALAASPNAASTAAKLLASGVLRTMLLTKIRTVALLLVAAAMFVIGVGFAVHAGLARSTNDPVAGHMLEQEPIRLALAPKKTAALSLKHGDEVRDAIFTTDGKHVISACFDGTFRRWDIANGKELSRLKYIRMNSAIAMSRDGKQIAGGNSRSQLFAWDAMGDKEIYIRNTRHSNVFSLSFSPDGKKIASANGDGTVVLWNAEDGAPLTVMSTGSSRVWSVAFAPKEKLVVSGGEDGKVRLWNSDNGKQVRSFEGLNRNASSVCFSPDGSKIAAADMEDSIRQNVPKPDGLNDTIRIWEVATGKELTVFRTPLTHSIAFSPDGKTLASADRAGTVHLWNVEDGKRRTSWSAHTGAAMCVQFHSSGERLLSAGQDGAVNIWSLK